MKGKWQTNDIHIPFNRQMTNIWLTHDRPSMLTNKWKTIQEARKKDMLLAWPVARNYLNTRQLHAFQICIYIYIYIYIHMLNYPLRWRQRHTNHRCPGKLCMYHRCTMYVHIYVYIYIYICVCVASHIKCWIGLLRCGQRHTNHRCPGKGCMYHRCTMYVPYSLYYRCPTSS